MPILEITQQGLNFLQWAKEQDELDYNSNYYARKLVDVAKGGNIPIEDSEVFILVLTGLLKIYGEVNN